MVGPGRESFPRILRLYFILLFLNHSNNNNSCSNNYSNNYSNYNIRPPLWAIKEKVPIEIRSAKVIPLTPCSLHGLWILITF